MRWLKQCYTLFVGKKAEKLLCQDYVREIREKLDAPILGSSTTFSKVFRFVLQVSERNPFTLIIDEFQNFLKINPKPDSHWPYSQRSMDIWTEKRATGTKRMSCAWRWKTCLAKHPNCRNWPSISARCPQRTCSGSMGNSLRAVPEFFSKNHSRILIELFKV